MTEITSWKVPGRSFGVLQGASVRLEPLERRHCAALHMSWALSPGIWRFLPYGPFRDAGAYAEWAMAAGAAGDPLFYALDDGAGPAGVASYLRITPLSGIVEIGHIALSPRLQRSRAATEALSLMIGRAFELGYRRVEWKCNAQNHASRRAAQRLGFSFEGVHRQAAIVKGRNRDTAWFSIIDGEWPALRARHAAWLAAGNFDADGRQTRALSALTAPLLAATDPAL
ncbi:GNAT family N-acetyltransferase [Rhodobacteraceae bacterium 2CG4]|uniref:GNAT family N-acetyltransferase n=1 Tax=Halovulum marinum TaxID=2662447 RepID=A0A6L5YV14_9RHOB|nr:GNAT family protein [Halovulum marinum]MSU88266.1 GNAT family N-acetyltransferase [Halovulum marinum]